MLRAPARLLPFLLLLPALLPFAARTEETPGYAITDLGTLTGDPTDTEGTQSRAINNRRQVVGVSRGTAFLWQQGTMVALEMPPEPAWNDRSEANDINEKGIIVGAVDDRMPVVWEPGKPVRVLPYAADWVFCHADAINDSGRILGGATLQAGGGYQALKWDLKQIPTGGPGRGLTPTVVVNRLGRFVLTAINQQGAIAGSVGGGLPVGRRWSHAALWERPLTTWERPRDLGTLGGRESWPTGINDLTQVVGVAEVRSRNYHAFFWTRGRGMRDLGTLGGVRSWATAISDAGEVVGTSEIRRGSQATHAFLWRGAPMEDLNSLIPANSGWVLQEAADINDHGDIVGSGLFRGEQRAFLLTRRSRSF